MGRVYEAVELATDRRVAIKVISEEVAETHDGLVRFQREVRLAASLSHPRCVFVYGTTEVEGRPAIVMELCTGGTLQDEMDRGDAIPIARAVGWTLDVLEGLSVAHAAGIVHRDVKPSNCFLTVDGRVKVGDFGLALALVEDTRVTQSGVFLGSPLYTSPEQARGGDVDERSDVYSAAATLHALLAGRPPFTGRNLADVLARIATEPVPKLRKWRRDAPRRLESVLSRAMGRDPRTRPVGAAALHADLSPFLRPETATASLALRFTASLIDAGVQALALFVIRAAYVAVHTWQHPELDVAEHLLASPSTLTCTLVLTLVWGIPEGLWGAGLGKWLCGLRVVSTKDTQPNLVRAVFRAFLIGFAPWLISMGAHSHIGAEVHTQLDALDPLRSALSELLWGTAICLALFVTMRRGNGWRGIHELASGTRVIAVEAPFSRLTQPRPARSRSTPSAPMALNSLRVGPYERVERVLASTRGQVYVGRDTDLERDVWIVRDAPAPLITTINRARDLDLRWLRTIEWDGQPAQVFELPRGELLLTWAHREGGISAATRLRWLTALVAHLEGATTQDQWRIGIEALWVDHGGDLRVLPGEWGESVATPSTALGALAEIACKLEDLRCDRVRDIVHPSTLVVLERATYADCAFADLPAARRALDVAGRSQATVSRARRTTQLLVAGSIVSATVIMTLLALVGLSLRSAEAAIAAEYRKELMEGRHMPELTGGAPGTELSSDSRRAREIMLVSYYPSSEVSEPDPESERKRQEFYGELHSRIGVPSEKDVQWASRLTSDEYDQSLERLESANPGRSATTAAANTLAFAIVLGLFVSLGSRLRAGAISFAICGLQVCHKNGRIASRRRRLARSLVIWIPLGIAGMVSLILIKAGALTAAWWVLGGAATAPIVVCAHAIYDPSRSMIDRIAGTRLVHLSRDEAQLSSSPGALEEPPNRANPDLGLRGPR